MEDRVIGVQFLAQEQKFPSSKLSRPAVRDQGHFPSKVATYLLLDKGAGEREISLYNLP
jgi:hypothetical protein